MRSATALAARHSLRWRLPVFVSVLIAIVLTLCVWTAYTTVRRTLVGAGAERARAAADQVAALIDAQGANEQLRRIAADPQVGAALQAPSAETLEAARRHLFAVVTGPRRVEVWDEGGSRVLDLYIAGRSRDPTAVSLPSGRRPTESGVQPLQLAGGSVLSSVVAEIPSPPGDVPDETPHRVGYLVYRSALALNRPGTLSGLVGSDAIVMIGNRSGDVWTDFARAAPAPQIDLTRSGGVEYRSSDGEEHLGALSSIRGTPWVAWVELPHASVVAPARVFLNRMVVVGLIGVAIGAVLAYILAARITKPLIALTEVEERIVRGDYSRRATAGGHEEAGRLLRAGSSRGPGSTC